MTRVTVLRRFTDLVERCSRMEGDVFEVTDERASQLEKRLPVGYVSLERIASEVAEESDAPDYASMTKAELVAACGDRGIEVPKRATKAALVKLLSEE